MSKNIGDDSVTEKNSNSVKKVLCIILAFGIVIGNGSDHSLLNP